MKTASAEHSTLKMPLRAQYHGVSAALDALTSLIPVGKPKPSSRPTGAMVITEAGIFTAIDADIKFEAIVGKANLAARITPAIATGYTKTHGL
jgi:hypothetical protein